MTAGPPTELGRAVSLKIHVTSRAASARMPCLAMRKSTAPSSRPALRDAPDGECGRGLHIVAALASEWGRRPDGAHTTVWAEFPSPGAAAHYSP